MTFRFVPRMDGQGCRYGRPLIGVGSTGLWRSYKKAVGAACLKVCFQKFRGGTFDTQQTYVISKPDIQRKSEGLRAFAQESSPNKIDTRLSQLIFIRCWRDVV